jgi:hypothetical protein
LTRRQLRSFHTPERLAEIYDHPYDHTRWEDHRQRVAWTIGAGVALVEDLQAVSLVDLSCGDGAVLRGIQAGVKHETHLVFGDLVQADHVDLIGPIESSIMYFNAVSGVDGRMLVLTETVEHLEDPDRILRIAREAFSSLLVTTPIDETDAHGNEEHYWSWSEDDVRQMLVDAGWHIHTHDQFSTLWYNYQLWGCR